MFLVCRLTAFGTHHRLLCLDGVEVKTSEVCDRKNKKDKKTTGASFVTRRVRMCLCHTNHTMSVLPSMPPLLTMEERSVKKARYMSKWENTLVDEDSKPGIAELFGSRQARRDERGGVSVSNFSFENQNHPRNHERFLHEQDNGFFTFRLEHREGGAMAQHRGEERILLFRSDRVGSIAKIIYSSTPAPTNKTSLVKNNVDEESELGLMTQAKIHVLDVKEQYRGMDLG